MVKYYKISLVLAICLVGLAAGLIVAQAASGTYTLDNPIKAKSFEELFVGITNWLAGIIASLAMLMVVFGGLQYLFSGGNEEKVKKANKTILYALIGLLVVGASWGLLQTLLEILGQS